MARRRSSRFGNKRNIRKFGEKKTIRHAPKPKVSGLGRRRDSIQLKVGRNVSRGVVRAQRSEPRSSLRISKPQERALARARKIKKQQLAPEASLVRPSRRVSIMAAPEARPSKVSTRPVRSTPSPVARHSAVQIPARCKKRPASNAKKSGSGSRRFIPWC